MVEALPLIAFMDVMVGEYSGYDIKSTKGKLRSVPQDHRMVEASFQAPTDQDQSTPATQVPSITKSEERERSKRKKPTTTSGHQ